LGLLLEEDPAPPHEEDPAVPEELSRICLEALSRGREERTRTVQELAGSIRGWQQESAVDREVAGLLEQACAAWEDAEGLAGEALLRQLDSVLGRAGRALELRPEEPEARSLVDLAESTRARALAEGERAARRSLLKRVLILGLLLSIVVSGIVAWLLDAKRRDAEDADRRAAAERDRAEAERDRAESEKEAKERAQADVLRHEDANEVRTLVAESDELWPLHPDRAGAMADWIERVRKVSGNRDRHEAALADLRNRALPYTEEERLRDHAEALAEIGSLRGRPPGTENRAELEALEATVRTRASWRFAEPSDAGQHEVLADLLAGIRRLADGEDALLAEIQERMALAVGLEDSSIRAHQETWDETIAQIAVDPVYRGVRIEPREDTEDEPLRGVISEPIVGLVPLGRDPDSGLYEFAHMGSGTVPRRDPGTGRLVYEDGSAIVLVLIPGGSYRMGAQNTDADAPNHDPQAVHDEGEVRELTLPPYLIAKHECTQAQWEAMTGGDGPSMYDRGEVIGGREITDRNPVERVSRDEASRWLVRHRLRLPTEAVWEHACRAGTESPWITGREVSALATVANLADAYCKGHFDDLNRTYTEVIDDGHAVHAPVGSFRANAFGLHDLHGNVWEWCEDEFGYYADAPSDGSPRTAQGGSKRLVCRGGGWHSNARICRSANRHWREPGSRSDDLGFRPAATLR
jgi:formylglycine-generating enzyme required for sulfatase activity